MLQIKELKAGIESNQILKGINLEVKAGEIHAIMGPNGSGKSTLSAVIAGKEEYEVEGGSITFDGKDLLELDPEERAHNGYFFLSNIQLKFQEFLSLTLSKLPLPKGEKHKA